MKEVMRWLGGLLIVLAASGCGATDDAEPKTRTSLAALCAGAPHDNGDGTVTLQGCAFEQQLINIGKYGHAVSSGTLFDADGNTLATVTESCDTWWRGTDGDGTDVIVDGANGSVRSHGLVHAGQITSRLPAIVKTPLFVH